jgi:Guanine nucleotide exchange factor in Golgi transport N-terminal
MNYYQLFRKMCLSFPLPIRDLYAVSCPEITSCTQHFELILLLQRRLFPILLMTLSKRSASRLALRGTRVFSLLLKQFSPKLETEATLGLPIKFVCGETDAGEPRPAWVDEGARDGDHTQVRPPLYLISGAGL